jgi:[CysO sulfur-carrier protein]-S-L-cysteine hydrolase
MMMQIPKPLLDQIYSQAEKEYPAECCGFIIGPASVEVFTRVYPCKNAQESFHEREPNDFPRTSKTAYFIAPEDLLAVQKETRQKHEEIKVIYHSHIDADAYFSEVDKRMALDHGEPNYPGVFYLVISVIKGQIKDSNLFVWNAQIKDFEKVVQTR